MFRVELLGYMVDKPNFSNKNNIEIWFDIIFANPVYLESVLKPMSR